MLTGDADCWLMSFLTLQLFLWLIKVSISSSCDVTINSTADGPKNGTFHSPDYPNGYGINLRCVYHLIGLPDERVQIRFLEFEVKGVPPRCVHDYIDVYTQAKGPFQDLLDVPLHGRYCGTGLDLLPRLLISMHNVFILGFYSDHQKEERGFLAEYTFINGSVYNAGAAAPQSECGQTVTGGGGGTKSVGVLLSPTYPGMYPDNIFCFYRIRGVAGQRIRLTFVDVDLYSGGEHCPFDYIRVFDGLDNSTLVIGTYCGRILNMSIYSSMENLYVEFVTRSGRVEPTRRSYVANWESHRDEGDTQRRGFKATYEISKEFVDLDFIREGTHVRGTECDQMILSTGESSGAITSPGYPSGYPLNVTCHYYIDGLVDKHHLEKAKLFIDEFDIPIGVPSGCSNGYLSAYIQGQDITKSAPDRTFCGHTAPGALVTSNPRLLLIFNTSKARIAGRGFKARFQFVTDYAIPGTPATDVAKCHFLYRSTAAVYGTFNSPRHPSNYPDNATCIYEFMGLPSEQVRITFENFKVENNRNSCRTDYVEVYVYSSRSDVSETSQLLVGHYCGSVLPGPQLSEDGYNMMRVVFRSDGEHVNTGFRAKYEFIENKAKRCLHNITSTTSVGGGQIVSEHYPHKYRINSSCEWRIYGKQNSSKILLMFDIFSMEGNPGALGCGNGVLKVYTNSSLLPSYEFCGSAPQGEGILSQGNFMRLRFISSARAVGAKGFRLIWTEILPPSSEGNSCTGFHCKASGYCIANELKCNKMPNCGKGDISDETTECGNAYRDHGMLHIILGVVLTLVVLLVFIIICIFHQRRKSRQQKSKKDIEVRYVTRAPAVDRAGSACSDRLLKEKTEKVSIV